MDSLCLSLISAVKCGKCASFPCFVLRYKRTKCKCVLFLSRALQKAISNLSFSGVSGWIRFQGGNSNRILDLTIQQVFTNETRLIGQYKPFVSFGKNGDHPLLQLDTDRIHWLSPIGAILDDLNSGM